MWKVITFDADARNSIFAGIEEIAKTVWLTVWPFGYNVILDQLYIEPEIVNDWVTIVRTIDYEDRYKNIWAMMIKKAADRTNKLCWDGTSTTTILTHAIMKEWLKFIDNGVNPFKLSKHMNEISQRVIDYIKANSTKMNWRDDIVKVASISAQDPEIGELIAKAYDVVWDGWTIVVKESQKIGLDIEIKKGIEFESQIESIALINNEQRQQCELHNPYIFVTDKRLNTLTSIKNMLDQIVQSWDKDILLIVDDIDPVALSTLIFNKSQWVFNVWVVKAPAYGIIKENFFRDVCALTWATLFSHKTWLDFDWADIMYCGRAETVISGRQSTIIVWGNRNEDEINKISEWIKEALKNETGEREVMQLEARLAKLSGGIATIRVGYPSNIETTQKRMKIDDSVQATKSAMQEWIIRGEWVSLIEGIFSLARNDSEEVEEEIAFKILEKALQYPMKIILDNGWVSGDRAITQKIESLKEDFDKFKGRWYCFDSTIFENLLDKWIIDPVKVIRVSLENAVSLANMLLTSRSIITEDPEKKVDLQDFRVQ